MGRCLISMLALFSCVEPAFLSPDRDIHHGSGWAGINAGRSSQAQRKLMGLYWTLVQVLGQGRWHMMYSLPETFRRRSPKSVSKRSQGDLNKLLKSAERYVPLHRRTPSGSWWSTRLNSLKWKHFGCLTAQTRFKCHLSVNNKRKGYCLNQLWNCRIGILDLVVQSEN